MVSAEARPKFSVLMPAYNEARYLTDNFRETTYVMESLGEPYEIIIVDDGSRDHTAEVIKDLARQDTRLRPVFLPSNQGKGLALRSGFQAASGELIFFLDADLDIDPKQFRVLLKIMQATNSDVVIGSKRHPQSVLHYPWRRRVVSAVYFLLVKLMFGLPIKDTQTGIKLFQRRVLEKTFPKVLVKKYAFDLELLVLVNYFEYKIAEAPVVVNYRGKFGHIGLSAIFNTWWDTMAVWYRLYLKRYYGRK